MMVQGPYLLSPSPPSLQDGPGPKPPRSPPSPQTKELFAATEIKQVSNSLPLPD